MTTDMQSLFESSEANASLQYVTPAIQSAGWGDVGRVGSSYFISCAPHDGLTTTEYLRHFFTDKGLTKIQDASPCGAERNRMLGLSKFMASCVAVPSFAVQREFVEVKKHYKLRMPNALNISRRRM